MIFDIEVFLGLSFLVIICVVIFFDLDSNDIKWDLEGKYFYGFLVIKKMLIEMVLNFYSSSWKVGY